MDNFKINEGKDLEGVDSYVESFIYFIICFLKVLGISFFSFDKLLLIWFFWCFLMICRK